MGCILSKQQLDALRAENQALKSSQGRSAPDFDVSSNEPCRAELTLDDCLPCAEDYVAKRKDVKTSPQKWGIFKTSLERSKFIKCTLLVLSSNGFHPISDYHIDLFFLRVGDKEFAYRASLAAMNSELIVRRSVVGSRLGENRRTAFIHLMFDIEQHFAAMLNSDATHLSRAKAESSVLDSEMDLARLKAECSSNSLGLNSKRAPSRSSSVAVIESSPAAQSGRQTGTHSPLSQAGHRNSKRVSYRRPSVQSLASSKSKASRISTFIGSTGPAGYPPCVPIPLVHVPNMLPYSRDASKPNVTHRQQGKLASNLQRFQNGPYIRQGRITRRMSAAQFQPPPSAPYMKPRASSMTQVSRMDTPQARPLEYFAKEQLDSGEHEELFD